MAFVLENIPEDEMKLFDRRPFEGRHNEKMTDTRIAIDRERNMYLVRPGGGVPYQTPDNYVFYLDGNYIVFTGGVADGISRLGEDPAVVATYLRTVLIPLNLKDRQDEIIDSIIEACRIFHTYGGKPDNEAIIAKDIHSIAAEWVVNKEKDIRLISYGPEGMGYNELLAAVQQGLPPEVIKARGAKRAAVEKNFIKGERVMDHLYYFRLYCWAAHVDFQAFYRADDEGQPLWAVDVAAIPADFKTSEKELLEAIPSALICLSAQSEAAPVQKVDMSQIKISEGVGRRQVPFLHTYYPYSLRV